MRLLLIAYHFPPSAAAGSHRSARFSRLLPGLGWSVDVLTVHVGKGVAAPADPPGVRTHRTRSFRAIDWMLSLRRPSVARGDLDPAGPRRMSEARDVAKQTTPSPGPWQRFKDTLTLLARFPDPEAGWIPFGFARGLSLVLRHRPDALYTSGPPHSSHLLGWFLKRLSGRPWIADFRDPWSSKPWTEAWERREWRARGLRRLEAMVVRSADRVILNTEAMREDFAGRYPGIESSRFRCIPNGYDPAEFDDLAPVPRHGGPFRLTHAGSLYRRRSPLVLLDAIRTLFDSGAVREGDLELELIGPIGIDGISLPRAVAERRLASTVRHVPFLPHREALRALFLADALVIVQPDTQTQVPGKLYEYLFVGKPVVALAHAGATADLVQGGGLGWVADPDSVAEVAAAILAAVRSRGRGVPVPAARERLLARHHAGALTAELSGLLRECVHARAFTGRESSRG